MSATVLRVIAVILVVGAIVLGFLAFRFSQGVGVGATAEAPAPPPTPGENQVLAVVAVKPIPAYEPIPMEAVALVPITVKPPRYYTDTGEVVGRVPLQAIGMGAPITPAPFASAHTLAQAIPEGSQAMALEISDVIAVGDFVKPGDIVDVLVYIRSSGREVENSQARVLLKAARVLAYKERLINASADADSGSDERGGQATVVLAVPKKETTRVMLGASLGELRLALHAAPEPLIVQEQEQAGQQTLVAANEPQAMPEAVAPAARPVAARGEDAEPENAEQDKKDDKVITLEELAAIKKHRDANRPRPPPRALIRVYRGTESTRISRRY